MINAHGIGRNENFEFIQGNWEGPSVAQWLQRPLGVREAGVRFPTASHQRRKNWEVCASQLGAWH